jgi:hypothetical protein
MLPCSAFVADLFPLCSVFVAHLFHRLSLPSDPIAVTMDDKLRFILDALPQRPPRSCLEPLGEFIEELRRRGRTYQEIALILAEYCGIIVSYSTVYRFLHSRARRKPQQRKRQAFHDCETTDLPPSEVDKAERQLNPQETKSDDDEIRKRIAALKSKPATTQTERKLFHYDPNEPLRLPKANQAKG